MLSQSLGRRTNMFGKIIAAITGILTIGLVLYVGVYLFTHLPK
jgi:ABC-type Na+ efflux pump permease subunit